MKQYLKMIFVFLSIGCVKGYSQNLFQCPDQKDFDASTNVCGLYGDANGNSNWNWEITDVNDPNYCKQWYAKTSSNNTKLTAMGSPFVNSTIPGLDIIAQNKDFTKEKGWELLQRNFGCFRIVAYPYFVLYNKYSGLMRIFIYQPAEAPEYSSFLIQIQPTTQSSYPATTSLGDELVVAPDKYLNGSGNYGKMVVAVSEHAGRANWSLTEFMPGFDPNIQNAIYNGKGLQFTLFGVLTNNIKASINGRSVTSSDPAVYNFNYSPANAPSSSDGQNFDFKAEGEKFAKFGKSITEVRDNVNKAADNIVKSIPNSVFEVSVQGRTKALAALVREATQNDEGFGKVLGNIASLAGAAGGVLGLIGNVVGFFSGGSSKPAPMPVYTSYDLTLQGTLTAKTVSGSFIIRVPGAPQPDDQNATYYKCPMGIFNIKNTPEADKVVYSTYCGGGLFKNIKEYVSYKMRNNIQVSYNSGAALNLVSVEAAIVGQVLPGSDGNAAYDLLAEHGSAYNYMLPDLQAGRLVLTAYDPEKKLHIFQTPYVNIECLNGLAFNAQKETKVFLRIRAVLKKANDPENTPIYYIRDYAIQTFDVTLDDNTVRNYLVYGNERYLPPYTNYTELPAYVSDATVPRTGGLSLPIMDVTADNSITTQNDVIIPSGKSIVFKAGFAVKLEPGFQAQAGSEFRATLNRYGYNISCGSPQIEAYQYPGGCYNLVPASRTITNQDKPEDQPDNSALKIYPIPTNGNLTITGLKNYKDATISVIDQSGRCVRQIKSPAYNDGGSFNLDVSSLDNGVYFIKIQTLTQITTRKITVNK